MQENYVIKIGNTHGAAAGSAPNIDTSKVPGYYSYFQNGYGEQFCFFYDFKSLTGTLHGGDLGWDNPININADGSGINRVILSPAEKTWVQLCWSTVHEGRGKPEVPLKFSDVGAVIQAALDELKKGEVTE